MSTNLNINTNTAQKGVLRPPFFSDIDTWHKGISGVDFAESINNLPAKFLPRYKDYNGTDDYDTFGNLSILNGLTTATFLLKFKSTDTDANQYMFAQAFNGQTFRILLNSGKLTASVTGSSTIISVNNYNDGIWHYVALVLNGSALNLFADTIDKGSVNDASALAISSDDHITLGARSDNGASAGFCECGIACAAIFNYAFDSQQIADFSNGIIPSDSILETYPVGEGDHEYDISSNENHATINGTGTHSDYDQGASLYLNTNGYSLWQLAANPDIQVPLNRSGVALSLTAGVDIPAGYVEQYNLASGGSKWNMADALEGYNETAAADTELEIFDRLNATRQTVASRASIYYDATSLATRSRYHVTEATDPVIYDTYFEAAFKDKFFGRLVLDGSNNIIRHDEQVVYATQKTGTGLTSVTNYCRITPIYP